MKPLKLDLPEPPSANVYYRRAGRTIHISAAGKAYKLAVYAAYVKAHGGKVAFPKCVVAVTIHWYRARKSGDLDNRIKPLLDALKGLAFTDDKQVVEIHAYRRDGQSAEVSVTISGL